MGAKMLMRLAKQQEDYLSLKAQRIEAPQWFTPNRVAWSDGKTELLECRKGDDSTPSVVIFNPEAGHSSHIGDYANKQSLAQCALENQPGGVYLINKLPAKQEHKNLGIEYCFWSGREAMLQIPGKKNVVGLCQGGWQSAVVAARNPDMIASLTLAAAPIDFHIVPSSVSAFVDAFPQSAYEDVVRKNKGLLPGKAMLEGFSAGKTLSWVTDEINLWNHADDPVFRERNRIFNNWWFSVQDQAGKQYLETVQNLFRDNNLRKYADLSRLGCPIDLIAGSRDPITPEQQLFALCALCPQAVTHLVDQGHIGVFMGAKAIAEVWTEIFRAMAVRQMDFSALRN